MDLLGIRLSTLSNASHRAIVIIWPRMQRHLSPSIRWKQLGDFLILMLQVALTLLVIHSLRWLE